MLEHRDIIIGTLALIIFYSGYTTRHNGVTTLKSSLPGAIVSLLIIAVSCFFLHFSPLFIAYFIASYILGIISSRFHLLIFWNVFILVLTGVFALSSHANQFTMLLAFCANGAIGFHLQKKLSHFPTGKVYMLSSISLFLYYLTSVIIDPSNWLNGLLISLLALGLGIALRKRKFFFVIPLGLAFFIYFSFRLFPDYSIHASKTYLLAHDLDQFSFRDQQGEKIFTSDFVIIDTWHQYCRSCFDLMEDMHPYLQNLEETHNLNHYYAFVGEEFTRDSAFSFDRLPFPDQNIIADTDNDYYKTLEMNGAPYLNFYYKKEYLFSLSGYNHKYKDRYRAFITEVLTEHEKD